MIPVNYFPAPWAGPNSLYAQVVGQEWINATGGTVDALRQMITDSYNAHHTGEGTWTVDDFEMTEIDTPS